MHLKKVVVVVAGPNPRTHRVLDLENNIMFIILLFICFHLFKIPSAVHICECTSVGLHDQIDKYEI